MQYVISDIHGNYEAYQSILKVIDLKNTDILYVLGDVLDYGVDGIKILQDMLMHGNIIPILGEHEFMAYRVLRLMNKSPEKCMSNPKSKKLAEIWIKKGGEKTLSTFMSLDAEAKDDILDFLEEFSTYEEVEVGKNKFVLVHGGFKSFEKEKSLDDYKISELLTGSIEPDKSYFDDKCIICGHIPTTVYSDEYSGKIMIIKKNNKDEKVYLDCGSYGKGNIGCYCLDNGEVYYSDIK